MSKSLNRTTTNNTKVRAVLGSCGGKLTLGSTDSLSVGTTQTKCSARTAGTGGAQTFFQARHKNHFDLWYSANLLILHSIEHTSKNTFAPIRWCRSAQRIPV